MRRLPRSVAGGAPAAGEPAGLAAVTGRGYKDGKRQGEAVLRAAGPTFPAPGEDGSAAVRNPLP